MRHTLTLHNFHSTQKHKDWKDSAPGLKGTVSTVPAMQKQQKKSPILPIMKCQSQRILGNQPFLRAAEPTPSGAGPKSREPHQGVGILQFKNADRKLSREARRNCVLSFFLGKKPGSGMWWQLSSSHWKRLPRETAEPPSSPICRAQFDSALNDLRLCFKEIGLAKSRAA